MTNNHTIVILAFNNHEMTIFNIDYLQSINKNSKILLYDNGSTPSFESIAKEKNIDYFRENENIYVNPAWNKIFELVQTKFVTLLNNDCFIISNNYFNEIINHMIENEIVLSSCKTFNIKKICYYKLKMYEFFYKVFKNKKLKFILQGRRQGWLMTLDLGIYKTLNYKIPEYIKIWFGDDWIWSELLKNKMKIAIYKNRYCLHVQSTTIWSENLLSLVNKDKQIMEKKGTWINNKIYNKVKF